MTEITKVVMRMTKPGKYCTVTQNVLFVYDGLYKYIYIHTHFMCLLCMYDTYVSYI